VAENRWLGAYLGHINAFVGIFLSCGFRFTLIAVGSGLCGANLGWAFWRHSIFQAGGGATNRAPERNTTVAL